MARKHAACVASAPSEYALYSDIVVVSFVLFLFGNAMQPPPLSKCVTRHDAYLCAIWMFWNCYEIYLEILIPYGRTMDTKDHASTCSKDYSLFVRANSCIFFIRCSAESRTHARFRLCDYVFFLMFIEMTYDVLWSEHRRHSNMHMRIAYVRMRALVLDGKHIHYYMVDSNITIQYAMVVRSHEYNDRTNRTHAIRVR